MAPKLLPSHLLDNLFKRSDAAGQRNKCIGSLEHLLFSLVHTVGDHNFTTRSCALRFDQKRGDNASNLTAVIEYRVGNFTHQPNRTAPVDQPNVSFGHGFPKCSRGVDEGGIGADPRAAIRSEEHTSELQSHHD